jgi:hypothetical protein
MGHRDLLVTQTYLSYQATTAPFISREASAAGRLCSNDVIAEVGPGTDQIKLDDSSTDRSAWATRVQNVKFPKILSAQVSLR